MSVLDNPTNSVRMYQDHPTPPTHPQSTHPQPYLVPRLNHVLELDDVGVRQVLQNLNLLPELVQQQVLIVHLHVQLPLVDHLASKHVLPGPALALVHLARGPDANDVLQVVELGELHGDLLPPKVLQDALAVRRVLGPQDLGVRRAGRLAQATAVPGRRGEVAVPVRSAPRDGEFDLVRGQVGSQWGK